MNTTDVSPTTDDRPFFYEFRQGLPDLLRQLLAGLGVVVVAGLAYLWRRRPTAEGSFWPLALYFALLGAGFMLVELTIIQCLALFLGHPTMALSVSLFAILISGGLGSLVGGRLAGENPWWVIVIAGVMAGLLALAYAGPVPAFLARLPTLPLALRIAAAMVLNFPLAFFMGMPFPLGLQIAQRRGGQGLVPLAWGINGVTSVVGSAGAMAIAILWGFHVVLVIASLAYGAVALLALTFRPSA